MTRIFISIWEALNEVSRDVAEMGILTHPKTVQDKDVSNDPDYDAMELQNYMYIIVAPKSEDIRSIVSQPYCDEEWEERVKGMEGDPINPGESWKCRPEVWESLLEDDGTFSYTYPERLSYCCQVETIIDRLKKDQDSRQLFVSIWSPDDIMNLGGISRVPCSLGYLIHCREGRINLTYLQRSSDLITHFKNDVFFAIKFQEYIAQKVNLPVGNFTHWIGSLHAFKKDVKDIF